LKKEHVQQKTPVQKSIAVNDSGCGDYFKSFAENLPIPANFPVFSRPPLESILGA
jgi:hypothetical protein